MVKTDLFTFATIGVLLTALLPGCSTQAQRRIEDAGARKYMREWYQLKHYPVSMYGDRWRDNESESGGLGPFESQTRYGPFIALRRYGKAMLLDASGSAIWAGSWIVPLRIHNSHESLLLLDAYRLESEACHEGAMYHITRLSFERQEARYQQLPDGYMYGLSGESSSWVADIDSDGSDEVVMVVARNVPFYASAQKLDWALVVYSLRRNRARFGRFEWEGALSRGDPASAMPDMAEVLAVPIGCAAGGLRIGPRPTALGGLTVSVLCASDERTRYRRPGRIFWSQDKQCWAFEWSSSAKSGRD